MGGDLLSDIAVVVPTHGNEPYLADALASLAADAAVTAEVVVVEDGTELVNEGVLGDARLLRLPHVGRSAARNAGVEAVSARYVAFLDADDVSLPGRLTRQRDVLAATADRVLCAGRIEVIASDSAVLEPETALEAARFQALAARGPSYESLLVDCPIYTSATMVVREAFLAAGGYDPAFDAYEDLDLYLRLTQEGELATLAGGAVAQHRRHAGNTSSVALYRGALSVSDKHLISARGHARRLLLERRVDSLWGLGEFRVARRYALKSVIEEPGLLMHPRLVKRLVASRLPLKGLLAWRTRR